MIYRRNLALPLGHDLYDCGEAEAVTAHQLLYPLPILEQLHLHLHICSDFGFKYGGAEVGN